MELTSIDLQAHFQSKFNREGIDNLEIQNRYIDIEDIDVEGAEGFAVDVDIAIPDNETYGGASTGLQDITIATATADPDRQTQLNNLVRELYNEFVINGKRVVNMKLDGTQKEFFRDSTMCLQYFYFQALVDLN